MNILNCNDWGMNRKILTLISFVAFSLLSTASYGQFSANGVVAESIGDTPAGTVISSQAFGVYQDSNGNASTVQSNIVSTTVSAVYGVHINPPSASKVGSAGTVTSFAFQVSNVGNDADTYTLTQTETLPDGWSADIVIDVNADGVFQEDEIEVANGTTDIAPGESASYHLLVTLPGNAVDGNVATPVVLATSDNDSSKTATGAFTLNVQAGLIELTKAIVETDTFRPGDIVTYSIFGENQGTVTVTESITTDLIPSGTTYVANSMRRAPIGTPYSGGTPLGDGINDGDSADFNIRNPGTVTIGPSDIAPGQAVELIYFRVQINSDAKAGSTISNIAKENFVNGSTPIEVESNPVIFNVDATGDSTITPSTQAGFGEPGVEVAYAVTVNNGGNSTDTIAIEASSPTGLNWKFFKFNVDLPSSTVPLTDTNGDGNVDTGPLPAGASLKIAAKATIAANTSEGTVDTTTLTATSSIGAFGDATETATIITTIRSPVMSITKTVSPTGAQPPQTVLTYSIQVRNTGSGTGRSLVVTDDIPAFTSYVLGSIKAGPSSAGLTPRTDANDGDGARFDEGANAIITDPVDIGPSGSGVLEFQVTID